jgi:hypothetical protein
LQKLERELWRAFHHRNRTHKADHFYNFCITALAMKDHFLEWKGAVSKATRQPYYDAWNAIPELVAASEIANTTKHAVLRESKSGTLRMARTSRIRPSTSSVADIYTDGRGNFKIVKNPRGPSITIEFDGQRRFELYQFMDSLVKYWRGFLSHEGVPIKRQQARTLYGEA